MGTFKINGELELNSYLTAATNLYVSSANNTSIIFRHGSTEYVRINPSGCLNIGSTQTANTYKLYVAGKTWLSDTLYFNNTASYINASNYTGNAATATKATQDGDGAVISSTYLKLAGGTMTGTIVTPGNDSVVIKPAKNNYDQIGASDCKFWKIHASTFIGDLTGTATKATQDGNGAIISSTYLKLSGGTMTGTLTFSNSNGIYVRHIDGESDTFAGDLYLNYNVNAPIHVGKGGSYTISADGSYYSGTAAKVADMPATTITKSLTVTTTWQNTGITSANLATGSYIVQVSGINNGNCGLWGDLFTGVMSWYDGGTNGSDADEIILHSAGHARNSGHLFLRTLRTSNTDGKTYLQIRALNAASAAQNVVFKFRRVI